MSEKRFVWKCDDENCHIFDTKEEKVYFNVEVVDLLNELSEENEQLRKELDNFKPVIFQDVRKGTVLLYSKGD